MKILIRKLTCLSFLFLLSSFCTHAQDIIIKKNKEAISAKILEIGLDEIKYKPYNNLEGPTISIAKEEVWKIKFENNSEWLNTPDPYSVSSAVEVRDRSRAIKFEFFSPLFGKLAFGYEQMIKIGINAEFKLGIIGPSVSNDVSQGNPSGVFVKFGPKFLLGSEYVTRGVKYTHQLFGKYFKPEIIVSTFKKDYTGSYYSPVAPYGIVNFSERYSSTSVAINLVYGKQSIVGNFLTVDWYIGLGYGFQSTGRKELADKYNTAYNYFDINEDYDAYCFSHAYGGPGAPLIYSAGLALGILVK